MPDNKYPEIVGNLTKHLFPDKKPYRAKRIYWILRQYFTYAMLAVLHGYVVGPVVKGKFHLVYKIWNSIPYSKRRSISFSSKMFGYEFKIIFDSKLLKKFGYYFKPDPRWKRKMFEIIESDKIYELISEQ